MNDLVIFIRLKPKKLDKDQFEILIEKLKTYNHVEMSIESIKTVLESYHEIHAPEMADEEVIPKVLDFQTAEEKWKVSLPGSYTEFYLAYMIKNFSHDDATLDKKDKVAIMARMAEATIEQSENSMIIFVHTLASLIIKLCND